MDGNSKRTTCLRARTWQPWIGLLLAASAFPVLADSTTGTTFTVSGRPTPGATIAVTVVVTGKHLVYGPGPTVLGGQVRVSVNGTLAAQTDAAVSNSTLSESGCVRQEGERCALFKYVSRNTKVTLPITLPKGVASYKLVASYSGDTDSHSSTSPELTLTPSYNSSTAVNVLLD